MDKVKLRKVFTVFQDGATPTILAQISKKTCKMDAQYTQ